MKIEIDPSDLEYGTHYRDEKCKELEGALQSDSRYAECEVKRQHWGDESTNPFHVFDENGKAIVELERWEIDALSGAEIITYIEVKRKRCSISNWVEVLLLGLFMGAGGVAVVFSLIGYFYSSSITSMGESIVQNLGWFYLLALVLGTLCVLKYRNTKQRKKNIDLKATRADPSFRDVLQKLADIPETENPSKKEYVKRLEYIEDASSGI